VVERTERMTTKSWAPSRERKPPEIFCRNFIIIPSRSAKWLVNGTNVSIGVEYDPGPACKIDSPAFAVACSVSREGERRGGPCGPTDAKMYLNSAPEEMQFPVGPEESAFLPDTSNCGCCKIACRICRRA
jgi:hypothetical protein